MKCQDSPTGEHDFQPDIEYDSTGKTINCCHCGELPRKKKDMTVNDLVAKMAKRASELTEMTRNVVMGYHPDCIENVPTHVRQMPKHELVNDILIEEFSVEFDCDIETI